MQQDDSDELNHIFCGTDSQRGGLIEVLYPYTVNIVIRFWVPVGRARSNYHLLGPIRHYMVTPTPWKRCCKTMTTAHTYVIIPEFSTHYIDRLLQFCLQRVSRYTMFDHVSLVLGLEPSFGKYSHTGDHPLHAMIVRGSNFYERSPGTRAIPHGIM